MKKIKFKDREYMFVGEELSDGGAIATQDDYENGRCSYAHLYSNGKIQRFCQQIGTIEDIEIIGEVEPTVGAPSLIGILTDPSWPL